MMASCGNSRGFSSGRTNVCKPTPMIHRYSITEKKAVQNKNCILPLRISISVTFDNDIAIIPQTNTKHTDGTRTETLRDKIRHGCRHRPQRRSAYRLHHLRQSTEDPYQLPYPSPRHQSTPHER